MPLIDRRCVVRLAVFFFALMSLFPAYASADITHNLVGWWKFDEATGTTAHDSSGYGNNGNICNWSSGADTCTSLTNTAWAPGKWGSAFSSTASQYTMVKVASSSNVSLNATTTGTVAVWLKLNSYSTWQNIVCKENLAGNPTNGYAIRLDNSNPVHPLTDLSNTTSNGTCDSHAFNATVPLGQWVHIAYTWDGAHYNQYFNGAVDQSNVVENCVPTPQGSIFYIGKCGNDVTDNLDGSVDDVRVYTRTLSASDIAQLAKETQSFIRKPANMLGLIGWWKMDEGTSTNAHDSSGNGYSGVLAGSTLPQWLPGKLGSALSFDGSHAYVNLPATGSLNITGQMSVCAWVNPTVNGTQNDIITKQNGSGAQFEFADTSGNISFGWAVGANADYWVSSAVLPTGVWSHVCATKTNNTTAALYINGTSAALGSSCSPSCGDVPTSMSIPITIGSSINGPAPNYWSSQLDDVRIYNRALSPMEVANLYQSKAAKVASTANLQNGSSLQTGLIGYWTFDGKDTPWSSATAGTAIDRSGNGNNGTLTNLTRSGSPTIGKLGQAFNFNANSYIQIPGNGFTAGSHPWTLSAWVKPTQANFDGNAHYIAQYDSTGVANETPVILLDVGGFPEVSSFLGTPSNDCPSATAAVVGKWMHIVGEYDGTNEVLYVNGKLDRTCTGITSNIVMTNPPLIGDNSGGSFQGVIDDVRIYNRALTDREVKQLYKLGQTTQRP